MYILLRATVSNSFHYKAGDKRKTLKVVVICASTFLLAFLIVCCNAHRQRKKGLEELKGTLDGNMADANDCELIYVRLTTEIYCVRMKKTASMYYYMIWQARPASRSQKIDN